MAKKRQTSSLIMVVVVIIILALCFIVLAYGLAKKINQNLSASINTNAAVNANKAKTTAPAKSSATTPTSGKTTLTYEKALEQYAGRIFQFSSSCSASPVSMVLKNNSSIMLDNRANAKRTITIGAKKYSVNAYGFAIVTVSSTTLPATLAIHCDLQYNVAKVTLQK